MSMAKGEEQLTTEQKLSLFLGIQKELSYKELTSFSEEQVLNIEYDESWNEFDRKEFCSLHDTIHLSHFSEYAYCLYHHCKYDVEYNFYNIRIYNYSSIDGVHVIFISPAFKKSEIEMAKVTVPEVVNKLGLVKGKLSIDLPSKEDLKELREFKERNKVDIKERAKKTSSPAIRRSKDEMIDNQDTETSEHLWSGLFLNPKLCTRIWTLGESPETGWGWFMLDGNRWYCRPIEIEDIGLSLGDKEDENEWKQKYNRGGVFLTNAYLIKNFPNLLNDTLTFDNLCSVYVGYGRATEATLIINVLIDSFLIKWK